MKMRTTGRLLTVVTVLVGAGCASPDDAAVTGTSDSTPTAETEPTVLQPPPGLGLQPVSPPDFDEMGETVQGPMRERYRALRQAVETGSPDPTSLADAYGQMGNLLLAARYYNMSEPYYLNAQALASDDPRWSYYLGHVYRNVGPLEEAVRFFDRTRELRPDDLATSVWLGEAHLALGQHEEAAAAFQEALDLDAASAAAWFGAGRVALATGDQSEAVTALERSLEQDPGATAVHYPLATAYRRLGDTAQAEAHLALQGDASPRPVDPLLGELEGLLESPERYGAEARAAFLAGNWPVAADLFGQALSLDPSDAFLRHDYGMALLRLGDAEGAEAEFERAIRADPTFAMAYASLGDLMDASGRPQEAVERYRIALEYEPGNVLARVKLAGVLGRNGRPQDALTEYTRALEQDPTVFEATLGYTMNLVRLGRYRDARRHLVEAREGSPEQLGFTFALARLLAAAPDDDVRDGALALTLVEELLAEERTIPLGETLAMSLAELGRFADAVNVQRELVDAAAQGGFPEFVSLRLAENLRRYEAGEPCRTPFAPDEMF